MRKWYNIEGGPVSVESLEMVAAFDDTETDSSGTPPASAYVNVLSEFILNPPCTTADWANIKARLETV